MTIPHIPCFDVGADVVDEQTLQPYPIRIPSLMIKPIFPKMGIKTNHSGGFEPVNDMYRCAIYFMLTIGKDFCIPVSLQLFILMF